MGTKQKEKGRMVDIPLDIMRDVTSNFERLYSHEGKVVIIGGRAINLQCMINARPTHDIDLLVPRKPTGADLERLPNKEASAREYFECSGNIESTARPKLYYHTESMADNVEIDLYYPYYSTRSGIGKSSTSIGGRIPVLMDILFRETENVSIGEIKFTVPKLEVMMVMKYNTWLERGKNDPYSKDMEDIKNIIRNHGNGQSEFMSLVGKVIKFMDNYIPERRVSVINGMLMDIPFNDIKDIDPRIPHLAADLVDKRYLLRCGT